MPEVLLIALRDVAEANGISKVARKAGINRVSIYKVLSKNGNPGLDTLQKILNAVRVEGLDFGGLKQSRNLASKLSSIESRKESGARRWPLPFRAGAIQNHSAPRRLYYSLKM